MGEVAGMSGAGAAYVRGWVTWHALRRNSQPHDVRSRCGKLLGAFQPTAVAVPVDAVVCGKWGCRQVFADDLERALEDER